MKLHFCIHTLATGGNSYWINLNKDPETKTPTSYAWINFNGRMTEVCFFHSHYSKDNKEKSKASWCWYYNKKL